MAEAAEAMSDQLQAHQLMVRALAVVADYRAEKWNAVVYRFRGRLLARAGMKSEEDWSWGRAWLERAKAGSVAKPEDHVELEDLFGSHADEFEEMLAM